MKHPILYRIAMYTIIGVLLTFIAFVIDLMDDAPFSSLDMRSSYYHGCNVGLHDTLTDESVARCDKLADDYKQTLDALDKQMNNE